MARAPRPVGKPLKKSVMGVEKAGQDRKAFLRHLKRTARERFDKHGRLRP